ncbi:uncharacterized protein LY89DRAFT_676828 [Mollisia scopiformis]|uniref:Uncharacterized protein n=1 Tax=Mollisia scopiformis TaxID=149040 RepID=A0A132B7M5_MOLSC|nr:uncharacterized protein LY89DRAFT_676828 [Mollisia scopiformis]KUJ08408.1 hypothetical protein LY89DRAFT_676828 [Mollisia scopiformis]
MGAQGQVRPTLPGLRKLLPHEIELLKSFYPTVETKVPAKVRPQSDEDFQKWCWGWSAGLKFNRDVHNQWCNFVTLLSSPMQVALRNESLTDHQSKEQEYDKAFGRWRAYQRKVAIAKKAEREAAASEQRQSDLAKEVGLTTQHNAEQGEYNEDFLQAENDVEAGAEE